MFKAKGSTLFFFFFFDFTHSDLLETYLPHFVIAAHQSEKPLSEAGMYRNIISQRFYKAASCLCLVRLYLHTAKIKAACVRDVQRLSVGTLLFRFPVNDHNWKINLNLIRLLGDKT